MSEQDKKNLDELVSIYPSLPPYLKGKLDGYAEAVKEHGTLSTSNGPIASDASDKAQQ